MTSYAIVTGGNRGLGLELCRKLVLLKKPVILTARSAEAGFKSVAVAGLFINRYRGVPNKGQEAADTLGSLCCVYQLDICNTSSIEAFVETLLKNLPGQQIDLLINNAGIQAHEWTKETFESTISTNVTGPVYLTRALEPLLKNGALVINVSSLVAQRVHIKDEDYIRTIHSAASVQELYSGLTFREDSPQKDYFTGSYSISKSIPRPDCIQAALSKATTLMSEELALKERHISLASVCPGWCRTGMGCAVNLPFEFTPPRSSEEGAESILWPFTHFRRELNGLFLDETGAPFRDCV